MYRVKIITPIWNRHLILDKISGVLPCERIAVVSNYTDQQFAISKGFTVVEAPNDPIGEKRDKPLELLRTLEDWDIALLLGCDNTVNIDAYNLALSHFEKDPEDLIVCFEDIYYFDIRTQKGVYWNGYKNGRNDPVGAGKFVHRTVLERLDYKVWTGAGLSSTDSVSWRNLSTARKIHKINCRESGVMLVDYKDGDGLNEMQVIKETGNTYDLTEQESEAIKDILK